MLLSTLYPRMSPISPFVIVHSVWWLESEDHSYGNLVYPMKINEFIKPNKTPEIQVPTLLIQDVPEIPGLLIGPWEFFFHLEAGNAEFSHPLSLSLSNSPHIDAVIHSGLLALPRKTYLNSL